MLARRSPFRRAAQATLTTALLAAFALAAPAAHAADPPDRAAPTLSPTPRSVVPGPGATPLTGEARLVTAPDTDPGAIRAVRSLLHKADVATSTSKGSDLRVYVGGPRENPAAADALKRMGVRGPKGLPPGGYVLAARDGEVVLAGADEAGTFYAAQTLRQLTWGQDALDDVEIRDWPAFGLRGGMESFYGQPWSQADLLRHLDFLGQHKMNVLQYAVTGDPRTAGALWREPYNATDLARFAEAIDRAKENHVEFLYRIGPEAVVDPSKGICHADANDLKALVARYEQLWSIGERMFAVGFDDVTGNFVCDLDRKTFDSDVSPLAAAQAHVVKYVQDNFIATHPGAELITVGTEYWGGAASTYKTRFAQLVPDSVKIFWTGPQVVSPSISKADYDKASEANGGRQLLIFDNYPVNDYSPDSQHLGPLTGRDPALAGSASGLLANEMQEAEASLISLYTVADFTWNPSGYDPQASWTRSLQEFGGPAYPALRTYAENNVSSPLSSEVSPVLRPLVDEFRTAYRTGGDLSAASQQLQPELTKARQAPGALRSTLVNPSFLSQSAGHLTALEGRAGAGEAAVRAVQALVAGDRAALTRARQDMGTAMVTADSTGKVVGRGVYDDLVALATPPRGGSALKSDSGAVSVFARGTDGRPQTAWQSSAGSGWSSFTALPGVSMQGKPEVVTGRNGAMSAFVRGSDNQIWTNWQTSAGSSWHGWVSLGGSVAGSPRAVLGDDGAYSVFARGTDGRLHTAWQTSAGGGWSAFTALPGVAVQGDPEVMVDRNGAMVAFVRGSDNQIWTNWQSSAGSSWHGWVSIGGSVAGSPTAVQHSNGAVSVFARGTDGRPYTAWQSSAGSGWSTFTALPGVSMQGTPEVLVGQNGAMSAFVRGSDNQIWTNWQSSAGSSWHGWVSLGGSLAGDPHAVLSSDGAYSLYAVGGDGRMYTSWQSTAGSSWSGWTSRGGSLAP